MEELGLRTQGTSKPEQPSRVGRQAGTEVAAMLQTAGAGEQAVKASLSCLSDPKAPFKANGIKTENVLEMETRIESGEVSESRIGGNLKERVR